MQTDSAALVEQVAQLIEGALERHGIAHDRMEGTLDDAREIEALIRADAYEQAAKMARSYADGLEETHPTSAKFVRRVARTLSPQPAKTRQDQGDA